MAPHQLSNIAHHGISLRVLGPACLRDDQLLLGFRYVLVWMVGVILHGVFCCLLLVGNPKLISEVLQVLMELIRVGPSMPAARRGLICRGRLPYLKKWLRWGVLMDVSGFAGPVSSLELLSLELGWKQLKLVLAPTGLQDLRAYQLFFNSRLVLGLKLNASLSAVKLKRLIILVWLKNVLLLRDVGVADIVDSDFGGVKNVFWVLISKSYDLALLNHVLMLINKIKFIILNRSWKMMFYTRDNNQVLIFNNQSKTQLLY